MNILSPVWSWVRHHPLLSIMVMISIAVLAELATIPWFGIADLAKHNPDETALMRQRVHEAEAQGKKLKIEHRIIPIGKLPRLFCESVVAAEDGMFYAHGGFDWFEMKESLRRDMDTKRFARGGSTITQQLAKNLYLSTSKDPVRKLKEAIITLLLERELSKERILELYVNNIEWGKGVFGVETASQVYFHKSAQALTPLECYRLAAVIPSPLRHRPDVDGPYVVRRAAMVERRVVARSHGTIEPTTEEDESSQTTDTVPDSSMIPADTNATKGN